MPERHMGEVFCELGMNVHENALSVRSFLKPVHAEPIQTNLGWDWGFWQLKQSFKQQLIIFGP